MTYNLSSIMQRAHAIARLGMGGYRVLFRMALRQAWNEARRDRMSEAERIREAIFVLENKNRLSPADYAEMDRLRSELSLAQKRDLIESAGGRFASVVFTKKDGSQREMRVQPAKLKFHVKGSDASEAARKAVQTRKERHPNLLPIWDVEASAPRSVNLATISRIAVDGAVHEYRVS